MMRRTMMVLVVSMLAAALVFGAPGKLVLEGGQTLEVVSARLAGSMVYVTLPSGEMRAYSAADVDLEASGLVPKKAEKASAAAPRGLADLANTERRPTRVTITDADVEHVRPVEPSQEEGSAKEKENEAGAPAQGKLIVSVQQVKHKGNKLNLQGKVLNQAPFPVTGVRIKAEAKDSKGKVVGSAEKSIGGTIDPNGSAGFSMTLDLTSDDFQGTSIRVVGATAAAKIERPEEAAPTGGTPAEGEE